MNDTEGQPDRLIIGVDGGGTKTEAILVSVGPDGRETILGQGFSGPSNMRLAGRQQTLESLDEAIRSAVAGHLEGDRKADIAVLALAGSDFSDVKLEITQWSERCGFCKRIEIISDVEPVLASGTAERWGVALVVGTGSVAIGLDAAGRSITRGGWGHWYGDKGSGYDLGRRALAAVSLAEDGMGPETALHARMLEHFGLENPRLIIQKLYSGGNVRSKIASVAPIVLDTAEAGDITAVRITEECSSELVRLVTAVTCDLEFSDAYPLALAGGVICGHPLYRGKLEAGLHAINPAPGSVTLVPHPVRGCIRIGLTMLEN